MTKRRREPDSDGTDTEMAKRRRGPGSNVTVIEMAKSNSVFVDTSLDTHLAMLVSSSDTVSDFKKKMPLEHKRCFPNFGEIQVHSVKVERRSNLYHLPDSMLLWSAFEGEVKGNWFLSADVSCAHTCHSIKNSSEQKDVMMGVPRDDNSRGLSSDVNRIQALPMLLPNAATEKTMVSEMIAGLGPEKFVEKTIDSRLQKRSKMKMKRKMRKTQDECHNRTSEDGRVLFQADTSKPDIVSCANLMADSVRQSPGPERNGASFPDATVRNDLFEETSPHTTAEKSNLGNAKPLLGSETNQQDDLLEGKMDDEVSQDAPTKHSDGVSIKLPDHVARSMNAGDGVEEANTDGSKSKKNNVQDTTDMEQTGKAETMKVYLESHKSELKEEEKGGVIMPSNRKASDHSDPNLMLQESPDADAAVMESKISSGSKKKKKKTTRQKKSVDTNLNKSGIEQTANCISSSPGLLLSLTDDIPEENAKGEGVTLHDKKDVQLLLESEDGGSVKKKAERSIQTSSGNRHSDILTIEAENPIIEFNKVDMGSENTANKKSSKKRKKLKHTASGLQENLPAEDQQVGVDSLETKETSLGVVNSEQGRQVDSSQVLYSKTEEKSNKIHEIAENSGNRNSDTPTIEAENPIIEFNKVDMGSENTENKKSSKKRKKLKHTASGLQENLPAEDQQVGVDSLETKETSLGVVNSEQGRQVDSSQVLYSKTEEKSNKIHEIAENSGNRHSDTPTIEAENPIIEFNKVDMGSENTANKKSSKKRKKLKHTASGLQENLPAEDQQVGVDSLETKETSLGVVNSEQGRQVDSSQVLYSKTEEKSNKIHEIAENSGNRHSDTPTIEAENPIIEFNKVDMGSENTADKKSSKKRKKLKHTASELQENLPGEDQQVGVDSLETKETSLGVINSGQGRQVDSSQVLYSKTEEKSNEIHGIAENTDDLKMTSEKGGEGINFKQYFVPDQDQDKKDSGGKVKKVIKSKMETSERVEDNDLPLVSNSTELQNSIKSLANTKAENKSHRRDNTRSKGGSAQNSDRDDVISNSLRRSSVASEKGVKDSSPLQKPDESLAAFSHLNKKNQTLDKSTSVRSEVPSRKQGNKRLQSDLNVTNMIPMKTPRKSLFTKSGSIFQENSDEIGTLHKPGEGLAASSLLNRKKQTSDKSTSVKSETLPIKQSGRNVTYMIPMKIPQKKSLFSKSGAIFQDNGGESSGDENGAVHSDSSSVSGSSVGGSDLSQDSTRNGSNCAEGRSTGQRNMSKLELSASKELTMDMILRSSKRFKKAKLLASQDESQDIEFVPDSQPS